MNDAKNLMVVRMVDDMVSTIHPLIKQHGIEFVGRVGSNRIIIQPFRVYSPAYIEAKSRDRRARGIETPPPVGDSWKMIVNFDDIKRFVDEVEKIKDGSDFNPGDSATSDIYTFDSPEVS